MLVIEDYDGCYGDALEKHYNFDKYSKDDDGKVLFHGMGCIEKTIHKEKYKSYTKKAYWNLEQPSAWYTGDPKFAKISANMDKYFEKIFTICPYTCDWLNSIQKKQTFIPSFMPFNEDLVVKNKTEKVYDVIYWGHVSSQTHINFIDAMKNFKYNFLSLGASYWHKEFRYSGYDKYITNVNMPREDMWKLMRETKICLITNHAYLTQQQITNVKSIKNWTNCKAFCDIDNGWVPQYKTRMIESAVNRMLMLVKKSPWDLDEKWFEAGKDFIFFEKDEELPLLIEDISSNWHKYEHIVESAYKKAVDNYTVEKFINLVKEKLDD
tara:strand:+ start:351 stop:1319 length:969 start_codon:yes stop_codon:yes gene_type:complete